MKRGKVMLMTALFAVIVLCGVVYMFFEDNTPSEITYAPVRLREWDIRPLDERTPEEQERVIWRNKLRREIPNININTGLHRYTFGQAAKLCDWVVAGTVEEVKTGPHIEGEQVVLSVDSSLYVEKPNKHLIFTIGVSEGFSGVSIEQRDTKPGDRMLAFLIDKEHEGWFLITSTQSVTNVECFDFDKTKVNRKKTDEIYTWSHIILDSKEMEDEAIRAAKGYLDIFGAKGKRDREKYVEILCSLLNSPVQRIRDDAESDLLLFYERELVADLDKLLADDRVRDEIKDYLRFLLRNEKPKEEKE